jgi:hypothetical protein
MLLLIKVITESSAKVQSYTNKKWYLFYLIMHFYLHSPARLRQLFRLLPKFSSSLPHPLVYDRPTSPLLYMHYPSVDKALLDYRQCLQPQCDPKKEIEVDKP